MPLETDAARFERILHVEWPRVVATLTGRFGDLQLAEDATQDAVTDALEQWPRDGWPDNPGAWLMTVAKRRAIDRTRREAARVEKEAAGDRLDARAREATEVAASPAMGGNAEIQEDDDMDAIADDELRLLFTCCHPALSHDAQIALTLRAVGGLPTPAIAHAFLVPEATMAQRLVRAKKKIKHAGIPFRIPDEDVIADRLQAVLTTIYLVFNEGYASTSGAALIQYGLCAEAVRLGELLHALLPGEGETAGLLALMLLTDARREARLDAQGELVLLEDQDRTKWDTAAIDRGLALVERSPLAGHSGPYRVQAEIAATHMRAPSTDNTDWTQIASLYGRLVRLTGSPVVELNRAVAVSFADGPGAGLAVLDELAGTPELDRYHLFHAARADLLRRTGRVDEARAAYVRALALAPAQEERRFLQGRIDALDHGAV